MHEAEEEGMQDWRKLTANKEFLISIVENDYVLPDHISLFEFAMALLPNFGSTDGELRDDLSYMILASSIIDKQKLTTRQLQTLLETVLDKDHLFWHIGETNTDSIFMRSFSALIVAAILFSDARDRLFDEPIIRRTKKALLQYAQQENDWRGYVEGKGWAHTMAHLSNALDECAQHPYMEEIDRKEILTQLSKLVTLPVTLYREEDMHQARIAYHIILGHQLDDDFLGEWLQTCTIPRDHDVSSYSTGMA
jgi:hypothetical protein